MTRAELGRLMWLFGGIRSLGCVVLRGQRAALEQHQGLLVWLLAPLSVRSRLILDQHVLAREFLRQLLLLGRRGLTAIKRVIRVH